MTVRNSRIPFTLDARDAGSPGGTHCLSAQGMVRALPCFDERDPSSVLQRLVRPAGVRVVMHTVWIATEDPLPAT
jgi:hypothetical protein